MVGSEIKSDYRVRASTILEVIISMVIIVVVFGIAMMIYSNVLRQSLSSKKLQAEAILHNKLLIAERTEDPVNQTTNYDDLRIEQEVKPYASNNALLEIDLTAFDASQQEIAGLSEIIIPK